MKLGIKPVEIIYHGCCVIAEILEIANFHHGTALSARKKKFLPRLITCVKYKYSR